MGKQKKPVHAKPSYYCLVYMWVKEECFKHGYAATIHGSMANDLDILACPWTDTACSADDLVKAIVKRLEYNLTFIDEVPTIKPHGRLAWSLNLDSGAYIDLSVMPIVTQTKRNRLHDVCS